MNTLAKLKLLALGTCLSSTIAWSQNALNFDGTDDYASAANASNLISGTSNFSMTFWVYTTHSPSGYPNFDGLAGFRNESNCDFYILQLGGTDIEARIRTNTGTAYSINSNGGINLNQWNHFALTYNGSQLKLYHDGALVQTVSASGSITASSVPFNFGYIPYASANFYAQATLEDVALWGRTLSASEISAMTQACGLNTADPDLLLAYELNQGTAGGNNAGITQATNTVGGHDATLSNLALSGANSNFVTGKTGTAYNTFSVTACKNYTLPNGTVVDSAGTYTDTIARASGCDSIVSVTVAINGPDTSVIQTGKILEAVQLNANYQWINCATGAEIFLQTARAFTATQDGEYAVVITKNGCTDTSNCFTVNWFSVDEWGGESIDLYPNPSKGSFHLSWESTTDEKLIEVLNLTGKVVWSSRVNGTDEFEVNLNEPSGVYLVRITGEHSTETKRLVIE